MKSAAILSFILLIAFGYQNCVPQEVIDDINNKNVEKFYLNSEPLKITFNELTADYEYTYAIDLAENTVSLDGFAFKFSDPTYPQNENINIVKDLDLTDKNEILDTLAEMAFYRTLLPPNTDIMCTMELRPRFAEISLANGNTVSFNGTTSGYCGPNTHVDPAGMEYFENLKDKIKTYLNN